MPPLHVSIHTALTHFCDVDLKIDAEADFICDELKTGNFDSFASFEVASPVDAFVGNGQVDSEGDLRNSTGEDVECEVERPDLAVGAFAGARRAGATRVASTMDEFRTGSEVLGNPIPSFALAIVNRGKREI